MAVSYVIVKPHDQTLPPEPDTRYLPTRASWSLLFTLAQAQSVPCDDQAAPSSPTQQIADNVGYGLIGEPPSG
jgi:hypothetical protein